MSKTVNYWVYASWRQNLKLLPKLRWRSFRSYFIIFCLRQWADSLLFTVSMGRKNVLCPFKSVCVFVSYLFFYHVDRYIITFPLISFADNFNFGLLLSFYVRHLFGNVTFIILIIYKECAFLNDYFAFHCSVSNLGLLMVLKWQHLGAAHVCVLSRLSGQEAGNNGVLMHNSPTTPAWKFSWFQKIIISFQKFYLFEKKEIGKIRVL